MDGEAWKYSVYGGVFLSTDLLGVIARFTCTHMLDGTARVVLKARTAVAQFQLTRDGTSRYLKDENLRAFIRTRVADVAKQVSLQLPVDFRFETSETLEIVNAVASVKAKYRSPSHMLTPALRESQLLNLTHLHLVDADSLADQEFFDFFASFPNLEILFVERAQCFNLDALRPLRKLRRLSLANISYFLRVVEDDGYEGKPLDNLGTLEFLAFRDMRFDLLQFGSMPSLTELSLWYRGVYNFNSIPISCPKLEKLSVVDVSCDSTAAIKYAALTACPYLRNICVNVADLVHLPALPIRFLWVGHEVGLQVPQTWRTPLAALERFKALEVLSVELLVPDVSWLKAAKGIRRLEIALKDARGLENFANVQELALSHCAPRNLMALRNARNLRLVDLQYIQCYCENERNCLRQMWKNALLLERLNLFRVKYRTAPFNTASLDYIR